MPRDTEQTPSCRPDPHAHETRLFDGFHVAFRNLPPGPSGPMGVPMGDNTCWIVMCLEGDLRVSVTLDDSAREVCLSSGDCLLHHGIDECLCNNCTRERHTQLLEIVVSLNDLHRLIEGSPLGESLRASVCEGRPIHVHRPMTAAIQQALVGLRSIIAEGDEGSSALVLSKALELVWHFAHTAGVDIVTHISRENLRAVEKVKVILAESLESPPGLRDLSARVGMSLSKLKHVFPMACGMTPYAYLRVVRMERAMRLLRAGGRSVTEVALDVGYSSLSHFSKVFADHFGLKPSEVKSEKPQVTLRHDSGFQR